MKILLKRYNIPQILISYKIYIKISDLMVRNHKLKIVNLLANLSLPLLFPIVFLTNSLLLILFDTFINILLILILVFVEPTWKKIAEEKRKLGRFFLIIFITPLIIGCILIVNTPHLAIRYLSREYVFNFLLQSLVVGGLFIVWSIVNLSVLFPILMRDED